MGRLEIALGSIAAGISDIQNRLSALEAQVIASEAIAVEHSHTIVSLSKSLHSDLDSRLHFMLDKFDFAMDSVASPPAPCPSATRIS